MSLPDWTKPDAFLPTTPDPDAAGRDWDSLVQGDLTRSDWAAQYPAALASAVPVTGPIGTPWGVSQTLAYDVNAAGNAAGIGVRSYRFVASSTGTCTATIEMKLRPGTGSGTALFVISDGATTPAVLAKTSCVLAAGEAEYTVSYAATEGVEYTLIIAANWTAEGGSAQARFWCSRPRVNVANGAGVFAQSFVRYDRTAATALGWPDNPTGISPVNDELVLDLPTNAAAVEWRDNAPTSWNSVASAESVAVYVGPATSGAIPTTFVARLVSHTGDWTKYQITRVGSGAGLKRFAARSTQWAVARALYAAAASTTAFATVPTPRVQVFGDSIAAGQMPGQIWNVGNYGFAARASWPNSLRGTFPGVVWDYGGGGTALTAFGYSAVGGVLVANPSGHAATVGLVVAVDPEALVVTLGTNDWGAGTSALNFGVAMAAMLDDIHAALPLLPIVLMSPIHRLSPADGSANAGGSTLPDYRTTEATLAAARSAWVYYIDGDQTAISNVGLTPDSVHPDQVRADAIFGVVDTQLRVILGY